MSSSRAASNPLRAKICSAAASSFRRVASVRSCCRERALAPAPSSRAARIPNCFVAPCFIPVRAALSPHFTDTYMHVYNTSIR